MTLHGPSRENGYYSGKDFVYQTGDDEEPLLLDMWFAPWTRLPTLHAHPNQAEHFHVVSGQFDMRVGRSVHRLEAGESILVEPDVMHSVGNASDDASIVYTEITPGLRTQRFFEELREIEDLDLGPIGTTLHYGRMVRRYRREYRYSLPVTAVFWASALVARLVLRDSRVTAGQRDRGTEGGA